MRLFKAARLYHGPLTFSLILGCPWKLVTIVSKLGYNLFRGLTTYLYWGYNPVTKYHGHPSSCFCFSNFLFYLI